MKRSAAGDGYNDLTTDRKTARTWCSHGKCTTRRPDQADYVTKSNDEDRVLHVIE